MSKELSMDKLGVPEVQPVKAVKGDLERAANGDSSAVGKEKEANPKDKKPSGAAMQAQEQMAASAGAGGAMPVIDTDRQFDKDDDASGVFDVLNIPEAHEKVGKMGTAPVGKTGFETAKAKDVKPHVIADDEKTVQMAPHDEVGGFDNRNDKTLVLDSEGSDRTEKLDALPELEKTQDLGLDEDEDKTEQNAVMTGADFFGEGEADKTQVLDAEDEQETWTGADFFGSDEEKTAVDNAVHDDGPITGADFFGSDEEKTAVDNAPVTGADFFGGSELEKTNMLPAVDEVERDEKGRVVLNDKVGSWSEQYAKTDAQGNTVTNTYNYQRDAFRVGTGTTVQIDPNTKNETGLTREIMGETIDLSDENEWYMTVNNKLTYSTKAPISGKGNVPAPSFGDLVEYDDNGQKVTCIEGTLQKPETMNEIEPGLFINGTVYQEDVQQMNVGDCYFLAALLQVIHYEPSRIVNMMSLMGNQVSTILFHKEGEKWVETNIRTELTCIRRDNTDASNPARLSMMGSRARLNYDPKTSVWSASIANETLCIEKTMYYEAALWLNCMEQAYSRFSQTYGQYGDGNVRGTERYDEIDGGLSAYCLHMFYGNDANDGERLNTVYGQNEAGPDGTVKVEENRHIIEQLLALEGSQKGQAEEDVHIMGWTPEYQAVNRLLSTSYQMYQKIQGWLQQTPDDQSLIGAQNLIFQINQKASAYSAQLQAGQQQHREGVSDAPVLQLRQEIDALSVQLDQTGVCQMVQPSAYQMMKESVGMVVCFINYDQPGYEASANIFMYNMHAYNVDTVHLVDQQKRSLKGKSLDEVMVLVDMNESTVVMQNPHGQTTPNFHQAQTRDKNTGTFTVSLKSFLSNVSEITVAKTANRRNEEPIDMMGELILDEPVQASPTTAPVQNTKSDTSDDYIMDDPLGEILNDDEPSAEQDFGLEKTDPLGEALVDEETPVEQTGIATAEMMAVPQWGDLDGVGIDRVLNAGNYGAKTHLSEEFLDALVLASQSPNPADLDAYLVKAKVQVDAARVEAEAAYQAWINSPKYQAWRRGVEAEKNLDEKDQKIGYGDFYYPPTDLGIKMQAYKSMVYLLNGTRTARTTSKVWQRQAQPEQTNNSGLMEFAGVTEADIADITDNGKYVYLADREAQKSIWKAANPNMEYEKEKAKELFPGMFKYTTDLNLDINLHLNGLMGDEFTISDKTEQATKDASAELVQSGAPFDMIVVRGVGNPISSYLLQTMKAGDVFMCENFHSSTFVPECSFVQAGIERVNLFIKVPAGTACADVEPFADDPIEGEILLPPRLVLGIDKIIPDGNKSRVYCHVI